MSTYIKLPVSIDFSFTAFMACQELARKELHKDQLEKMYKQSNPWIFYCRREDMLNFADIFERVKSHQKINLWKMLFDDNLKSWEWYIDFKQIAIGSEYA